MPTSRRPAAAPHDHTGLLQELLAVFAPLDLTSLTGVEYTGRGEREVFDRRVDRRVVVDVVDTYLFEVRYSGVIEFQVDPSSAASKWCG